MNKIDRNDVYENVIDWVCNLDGYDYAIGGILGNLPCPFDDLKMCDKYNTEMDKIIGSRIEIDVHKIVMGDKEELNKLHRFANNLTNEIVKKHNEFVDIAENSKFRGSIQRCIGVDKDGFCRYEIVKIFTGKCKYDVITKMIKFLGYENDYGWIYDAIYDNVDICVLNLCLTMSDKPINS